MPDEQIRIDITAEDDASKVVDEVADKVDELERETPEVTVTADVDDATRGIEEVSEDAKALSRQDTEILLRAKIDDAKASLKSLRDDLDQTGDKAGDTQRALDKVSDKPSGPGLRGNAIADLTGPLGEASGAASDFAGVFDGLGDISESVAGRVGVSAQTMGSAITGIGVAVAGAAAVWTLYRQRQEQARARQRELVEGQRKFNELLAEGRIAEAADEITKLYDDAFDAAQKAGVPVREFTGFLRGTTDELPTAKARLDELNQAYRDAVDATGGAAAEQNTAVTAYSDLVKALEGARDAYRDANGTLEEQDERLQAVKGALGDVTSETDQAKAAQERLERQAGRTRDAFDRIRGSLDMQQAFLNFQEGIGTAMANASTDAGNTSQDILDIKQDILDVAEAAKLTPIEVKTLLEKVDQGDLAGVKADVESYYARNKAEIDTQLRGPTQADIDRIKAEIRARFGTLNVDYRPVRITNNGQAYDGPQ